MKNHSTTSQGKKAFLLIFPSIALLVFFFIWPVILSGYYSLTDMMLSGSRASNYHFIGFDNFKSLFTDPLFRTSFANTLVFLVFSAIIGQLVLGFLIAMLMKKKKRWFRSAVGISVLAGWITPEVIVALCWVAFLSKEGTLNAMLTQLGVLKEPVAWLISFPMAGVIFANIWHGAAFSMLQFQAALDNIPNAVEEAALMDGANGWQKLWRITIPMVRNTIMTDSILITLKTLGVFGLIYAMTGGGPGTKTTTLSIYMYKQAFSSYQMGYGTSIALVLLLLGVGLSLCYMKFSKTSL
ncbi:MAG TPA: sugar ABC transporter permease [Rectinemataceae bacterium]|nr:sugar ABC transporter permease [Rectinemataceae bacterium]